MSKVWIAIWFFGAAVLFLLGLEYAVVHAFQTQITDVAVILFAMLAVLLVLFVVEGAEIAAVGLLDKDPDQIDGQADRAALVDLKKDPELFFTGRQLMVVSSVVGLTFLSDKLADIKPVTDYGHLIAVSTSKGVAGSFAFFFPTFIVLWFAQLLPKFMAQENPLRVFGWSITKLFLAMSIMLGKIQIGYPSQYFKRRLTARLSGQTQRLLPSRAAHYEAAASLRHGRGCVYTELLVVVGARGEIDVTSEYCFQAFGPNFDGVTVSHSWEGVVDRGSCEFEVVEKPPECGNYSIEGPSLAEAVFAEDEAGGPKTVAEGTVSWKVSFQSPVPLGKTFVCRGRHRAGPGAFRFEPGKVDEYIHSVKTPTTRTTFLVKPAADNPIVFVEADRVVQMTGERDVDAMEASRITIKNEDRGYLFEARYPLEGSNLRFIWKIGRR